MELIIVDLSDAAATLKSPLALILPEAVMLPTNSIRSVTDAEISRFPVLLFIILSVPLWTISKSDIEAKLTEAENELKAEAQTKIDKKASGKQKLKDLGLDDDEIKALMGA